MNNRRGFIATAAVTATATLASTPSQARPTDEVVARKPDGLNPVGVLTDGVKLVPVVGGKYKVWTKRVGHGATKILLLHGGPAFSHEYLEAMSSFLPPAGYEIYYYDQLGVNNSDQPEDTSLWTLPRYLDEVEEVRRGLGLDQFVLFGHSWGGILAMEYALRHPQVLKGLVVSNMVGSIDAYLVHTNALKARMPAAARARLQQLESTKDFDNPEYEQIMMEHLYVKSICRLDPWPDALMRSFKHLNKSIYLQMQGPSEFEFSGNLRGWTVWDRLPQIKTRTLLLGARHDTMDPKDIERMATVMPHAQAFICPNGSHLSMWDDQAAYFKALMGFLRRV